MWRDSVEVLKETRMMLDYLGDRLDELNRREAEFIESLADDFERENTISEKQLKWLKDIYDKV